MVTPQRARHLTYVRGRPLGMPHIANPSAAPRQDRPIPLLVLWQKDDMRLGKKHADILHL